MLHRDLIESVKLHEGLRLHAYKDSLGYWTIGFGTLLEQLTISEEQAEKWLREKLEACQDALELIPEYHGLNRVRRDTLTEMAYNLGLNGLLKFVKMWAAIRAGDMEEASKQALQSKWASQTGYRAITLSRRLRTGKWGQSGSGSNGSV